MRCSILVFVVAVASVAYAKPVDFEQLLGSAQAAAQNQPDEAIAQFTQAAALKPKDPRPYYMRAELEAKKGKLKEAEADYRRALSIDKKLAAVRAELGALLNEQKRY